MEFIKQPLTKWLFCDILFSSDYGAEPYISKCLRRETNGNGESGGLTWCRIEGLAEPKRWTMAKRNVSEIETGAGFFMGFVNATMDVAREKGLPFAAIYRLATAGGRTTLGKIVDLAHADWLEEQPKAKSASPKPTEAQGGHPYRGSAGGNGLPSDRHRVRVNRGPFPSMATLQEQFSKNGVSELFSGKYEWTKHSSRMGANDVTAEEVVMVVKQFTDEEIKKMGGLESENIIAWGLKNDLVPADEKEIYAFGINPETCDLQRKFWLVGLGSSAMHGDGRVVAVLRSVSDGRILGHIWFDFRWRADDRFLFVCK